MEDATARPGLSRRRLLAGSLAGAGALALASCADEAEPEAEPEAVRPATLKAVKVGTAPIDDPASDTWEQAEAMRIVMDAQVTVLPNRPEPLVPTVHVRALHDGSMVAFRLDWDDADVDDLTVRVDGFRDACAVLLAPGEGDAALRFMGSQEKPATLLHWKADWQLDMDEGVQGEAAVYPNRSIDVYPPLIADVPRDLTPADYEAAGATEWLPGLHVGNPLSASTRETCVEKLIAYGFGTSETSATQDALGRGERSGRGWHVVLSKPLGASDDKEMGLVPGDAYTCAFALWSGDQQDAGGRKSPSRNVLRLELEA